MNDLILANDGNSFPRQKQYLYEVRDSGNCTNDNLLDFHGSAGHNAGGKQEFESKFR